MSGPLSKWTTLNKGYGLSRFPSVFTQSSYPFIMPAKGAPLQKAKAKWAKLDANPNIVVLETRIVDNAGCAARDFAIGETILTEEPLIVLPRQKGEEAETFDKLEQIALTAGLGGNYLFSIYYFSKATAETKGRILEFFCPDLDKEGADHKRYVTACQAVVALPQFKDLTVDDLVRYLLVLRTNQHATGSQLECSALYELGSKVPSTLCSTPSTLGSTPSTLCSTP